MSASFESDASNDSLQRGPFAGKVVVLGVTGSIAAYKAVELCRRLMDAGAYVIPVLTKAALQFIGTPTFSALASEPAKTELFSDTDAIPHTRMGRMADLILIAPATATIIGEYAVGLGTDLLSATLLCTAAPVVICPAMHTEMWEHPSVQENLTTLRRRGVHVVAPAAGRLAGGDIGEGRLADFDTILEAAASALTTKHDLSGTHVVVTAGGTREAIDPVRFIANRSSGKQGYAIAAAARARGAQVTLVSTAQLPVPAGVVVIAVETAADIADACRSLSAAADVIVMAAAVADFRPVNVAATKIKKRDGMPSIAFEATTDVLAELSAARHEGQVIVGFAAETSDVEKEALAKLEAKGLDLIVLNDVSAPGVGFGYDTNAVTIFSKDGARTDVPLAEKSTIADAVLDEVVRQRGLTRTGDSGATTSRRMNSEK